MKTFERQCFERFLYVQTLFHLHLCEMILLCFTPYLRSTLKQTFKPLSVRVKRKSLISTKSNIWFAKNFETLAALRNINCFQCIQFYVSKIGMWLKQSEGVKSLENFHNMEEGSLLNAILAESFEKMQFDPPPFSLF